MDALDKILNRHGFRQVAGGAATQRAGRRAVAHHPRHQGKLDVRKELAHLPEALEPVHSRHFVIENGKIHVRGPAQHPRCPVEIGRGGHGEATDPAKVVGNRVTNQRVIVGNQNVLRHKSLF